MSLPYYKRFPRDFLEGTIGLPFEVKCAYAVVLDMIYMRDGRLPDDARFIAGQLGCSVRKWTSIRESLIEAGKLMVQDGIISNFRADYLTEESRKYQDKQAEIAGKPRKNKAVRQPQASQSEPEPEYSSPKGECRPKADPAPVQEAFDLWNETARRAGLPVAKALSTQRRTAIRTRLRDGGIDGWREALRAVEASSFCRGDNDRNWSADLDFVCQRKSYDRLREGAYADKTGPPGSPAIDPSESAALRARHEALLAGKPHAPAC